MLMTRRFGFSRVLLVFSLLAGGAGTAQAASKGPALASKQAREFWLSGADRVLAGDFSGAIAPLERVHHIEPGQQTVAEAIKWMRDLKSLNESREHLRRENYDREVEEAKKLAKAAKEADESEAAEDAEDAEDAKEADEEQKPSWSKALDHASMAYQHIVDAESAFVKPDEFRAESWLTEIVEGTQKEIDKYKSERKWRDAFVLYSLLKDMFPKSKEYEKGMKVCQQRAHFEVVYCPRLLFSLKEELNAELKAGVISNAIWNAFSDEKVSLSKKAVASEEDDYWRLRDNRNEYHLRKNDEGKVDVFRSNTTWEDDLRGVDSGAVDQILDRINKKYWRTPDFKALGEAAMENLLILAQMPGMGEVFPGLADSELLGQFVSRVEEQVKRKIRRPSSFNARDLESVFDRVRKINSQTINLPEKVFVDEFIAGLLEPLDEFTSVIWPSETEEFNKHTKGEFIGVGIQITKQEAGPIRVESPLEDSPAYRAGIQPGDFITEVNGESTVEMRLTEAVDKIMGRVGTKVVLTIQDQDTKDTRPVTLVREKIKIQTVRGFQRDANDTTHWDYIMDPAVGVGYVRVSAFMDKTVEDLRDVLTGLRKQGKLKGLILDLRFNPGGLLTSAREMCELFLGRDQWIVRTHGRAPDQDSELLAEAVDDNFADLPLIILVNGYSASASEIVAGALAGQKEACVIGERTFGKGSVQNLIPLGQGEAYLKLTTAHYIVPDADSPTGWYHLNKDTDSTTWGVEPHVKVATIPQEVRKILRLRRRTEVLKGRDQDEIPDEILERRATSQPEESEAEDDYPDVDPQISVALNIMRMKLLSDQPWALAPREQRMLSRAQIGEPVETPPHP